MNSSEQGCLKVSPKKKTLHFYDFSPLFSIVKRKNSRRKWRAGYISMRKTLHVFDFSGFFYYLQEKEDELVFRILQLHSD